MGKVTFDTRYCVETPEEIQEILDEVARIYVHYKRIELLEEMEQKKKAE